MNHFTKNKQAKKCLKDRLLSGIVSINDLKELYYQDLPLTQKQKAAIRNFDRYRIRELQKQTTSESYNKRYMQLQVMSNLSSYTEFIKD